MGTQINDYPLFGGLFSKTRQAVLCFLYGRAGASFYTREVLDAVKTGRGTVQRELKNLTDKGIITRERRGRQVYYRANEKNPIFSELKSILTKTSGAAGEDREAPDAVTRRFRVSPATLAGFCRKHHIARLSLFGSVLRKDFGPESDIDVLVEFEPGHVPGFGITGMENELSKLAGRRIDLRTAGDLSRYFRERVVREAVVEYAATSGKQTVQNL
jgi:uncharacterized protein